jgi:ATP-binding cassette, subfamily B, bacterial PglK
MSNYFKEILILLGDERKKIPGILGLFISLSMLDLIGLGLVGPFVALIVDSERVFYGTMGSVIELLGLPQDQKFLIILAGSLILGVFLLKAISMIGINWLIMKFGLKQELRLRSFLMRAYQSMPYEEYLNRNSAEYIHTILGLAGQFSNVIQVMLHITTALIVGIVILIVLFITNAEVLISLIGMLGIILFFFDRIFKRKLKNYGAKLNIAGKSMVQGIHEGIEGLKELRVLGFEDFFHQKFLVGAIENTKYHMRSGIISTAPRYLLEFMMVSFMVLLVFWSLLVGQNLKDIMPTLGVFGVAILRLMPSATLLSSSLTQLRFARDSISRLHNDFTQLNSLSPLADAQNSLRPSEKNEHIDATFTSMKLNNVNFRYQNTKCSVLKDITLEIYAGESVGLIGPSGTGKTTLVDVILGLLKPHKGYIQFNGKTLGYNMKSWYTQVAYLPQSVFLIDNSLRHNVAIGVAEDKIDEEALFQALKKARLMELISQLPNGVDTNIGERGVRLSGGQRQRVALARAFYHGRSVLVMDESTSALDNNTEQEIIEEIKLLKGQVTLIVIAHRLTTLQHCDRIYRLDDGLIVEQGSYQQVVKN